MTPSKQGSGIHAGADDKLKHSVTTILDQPGNQLSAAQQQRLRQARELALARFDERADEAPRLRERLSLWLQRHTQGLRRSVLALSFAMMAGTGLWVMEGLLVEEEAVDAAILAHELPLEMLMDPHFSGSLHD